MMKIIELKNEQLPKTNSTKTNTIPNKYAVLHFIEKLPKDPYIGMEFVTHNKNSVCVITEINRKGKRVLVTYNLKHNNEESYVKDYEEIKQKYFMYKGDSNWVLLKEPNKG